MNRTKIEWTNFSWNPIVGCDHGCWYCYAKKLTQRFPKNFPNGFKPTFHPERLKEPWEYKKPSKIFVCSIADLFAPWTPEDWRNQVLDSIENCPTRHTFQLLTKNPELIPNRWFPDNVWIGATITDQSEVEMINDLDAVDAVVKFASFEPLLGDITYYMRDLDWAIIGKLTGSRKIPIQKEWVTNLLGQLKIHAIPVFMKDNLSPPFHKNQLLREFPNG